MERFFSISERQIEITEKAVNITEAFESFLFLFIFFHIDRFLSFRLSSLKNLNHTAPKLMLKIIEGNLLECIN